MDSIQDDRISIYEVGYLLAGTVPAEQSASETDKIKKIITEAGASIITEEPAHSETLAYSIRRKTVAGSYESYDEAYFGWIKFEAATNTVEAIKKSIEIVPTVLRVLMITTVRENTYLGKSAPAFGVVTKTEAVVVAKKVAEAPVAPIATVEEMDKSIDEMVGVQ